MGLVNKKYLLNSDTAVKLYESIASKLPIIDYHCHLSPKEIFEDKPFENIGEMWLSHDHYKWRLMRLSGIDEHYITGNASYKEKFEKYAQCLCSSAGNPLYSWSAIELSMYFGINTPLNPKTADVIWQDANDYIKKAKLSPRKLIEQSHVEYIATTDDICDDLYYHKKIKEDSNFHVVITPTFRTDKALEIIKDNYVQYIKQLEKISGVSIGDVTTFKKALMNRLDYFCKYGCRLSDIGIEVFPNSIADDNEADVIFQKALHKEPVSLEEYQGFLGNLYVFLSKEYKARNIIMQLHLAVKRNPNTKMLLDIGTDCGCDCVGDLIPVKDIAMIFDALNIRNALPKTIIYALNSEMLEAISTLAGSFKNVYNGAAWWFVDHKAGIEKQLTNIAQTGNISSFFGMLTDSRSFLSYARHDYFRRILCSFIGDMIDKGELIADDYAEDIIRKICYENIATELKSPRYQFSLAAFADEADKDITKQIEALKRNSISMIELRGVLDQSVIELNEDQAKHIKDLLDESDIKVWSLGSGIGKVDIHSDFKEHLKLLKHTLDLAKILECNYIRMFSFWIDHDQNRYTEEVLTRLRLMADMAKDYSVTLCHENEKGIFGNTAERCLIIHQNIPEIKAVFDPANFIQCGVDTIKAWNLLEPYIEYMHIKDCNKDGVIVSAGKGIGNLEYLLSRYHNIKGNVLTLEPHLAVFNQLKALENKGEESKIDVFKYKSSSEAFDIAAAALMELIE